MAACCSALRAALRIAGSPGVSRLGRRAHLPSPEAARRPPFDGARIHRRRSVAGVQGEWHHNPEGDEYAALVESNFANWRLRVGGLVAKPLDLSLEDLKDSPHRTQITRDDCVEGWSAIGKWQGVPLSVLLYQARLLPTARFVVFHCADMYEHALDGSGQYYESIDMIDAFRPQTILAHSLNDAAQHRPRRAATAAGRAAARLQAGEVRNAD